MRIILLVTFLLLSSASGSAVAETRPAVRPEDGGLPKEAIDETIRAALPEFRRCYTDEAGRKKKLGDEKVRTKFVIGASGKVTRADAVSGLGNHRIETCMESELRALKFPPPIGGGTVEIAYPFSFSPSPPRD